jgi:hypothetical protein
MALPDLPKTNAYVVAGSSQDNLTIVVGL